MKFLFDMDGTVTSQETLPIIAHHFGIEKEIELLTSETIKGNIPFIESFIRRVNMLGELPVDQIADLLENVELYTGIQKFISENRKDCIIVTGNLSCWTNKLCKRIGCKGYFSEALVENNKVSKLQSILRKEEIVKLYQQLGENVVFIGDGNNDLEAMRMANISIAAGLTHAPAKSLYSICDYLIFDEKALCRQLNQLL